ALLCQSAGVRAAAGDQVIVNTTTTQPIIQHPATAKSHCLAGMCLPRRWALHMPRSLRHACRVLLLLTIACSSSSQHQTKHPTKTRAIAIVATTALLLSLALAPSSRLQSPRVAAVGAPLC
ncbi:hypothetical protein LPJ71_011236, partial [Coemansia sp. S17]